MNGSPRSADEILALLRAHGDRVTASRRAVVEALVAGDHHVTADEIVARVAATAAGGQRCGAGGSGGIAPGNAATSSASAGGRSGGTAPANAAGGHRRGGGSSRIAPGDAATGRADAGGGGRSGDPEAHRATVYRTLDRLEELGVVSHVHLGHGPSTFHLDDRPHHHAVCASCGAVVEVPLDVLGDMASRLRRDHGFELSPHFALTGRCASCA